MSETDKRGPMDFFLDIYGTLPRAGPGSNELTRKAYQMMAQVPDAPRILDLGCGPGKQTIELLKLSGGTVVALDFLPQMIARVKTLSEKEAVSDRLETLEQDMKQMNFPASSFDVIWSEGAIYNMGFEIGLKQVKKLISPGGYLVVSDAVWLKPDPPEAVLDFWKEYLEIDTVSAKLDLITELGYEAVGHFVLPASAWTDEYYDPMEVRIAEKEEDWKGNHVAEAVLAEAKKEVSTFRQYSDYFSYAFFVMRVM